MTRRQRCAIHAAAARQDTDLDLIFQSFVAGDPSPQAMDQPAQVARGCNPHATPAQGGDMGAGPRIPEQADAAVAHPRPSSPPSIPAEPAPRLSLGACNGRTGADDSSGASPSGPAPTSEHLGRGATNFGSHVFCFPVVHEIAEARCRPF